MSGCDRRRPQDFTWEHRSSEELQPSQQFLPSQQILTYKASKGGIWQVSLGTHHWRKRNLGLSRNHYEIFVTMSGVLECSVCRLLAFLRIMCEIIQQNWKHKNIMAMAELYPEKRMAVSWPSCTVTQDVQRKPKPKLFAQTFFLQKLSDSTASLKRGPQVTVGSRQLLMWGIRLGISRAHIFPLCIETITLCMISQLRCS